VLGPTTNIGCYRRTRAMRRLTLIVVYTEVDDKCDKLAKIIAGTSIVASIVNLIVVRPTEVVRLSHCHPYRPGLTSMQHTASHTTTVLPSSHISDTSLLVSSGKQLPELIPSDSKYAIQCKYISILTAHFLNFCWCYRRFCTLRYNDKKVELRVLCD